ncbi:acyltransferase family protein [Massilia sp. GCM10020059]|uniref:Acyltransferase n=1 Tax=Massilia agrisoli TaxID=2892444 RepID=A0ABS8IUQ6_9BURK|nr:acyltransferase [Massilia agrisoli]MCC6072171.1 acyltransferase [Massilia agrisoli]
MASIAKPGIRLREPELGEDSCQSLLIALLRGLCAVEVAAAHLRAEFFPGLRAMADPPLAYQALAFFTGFAHQAVVLFFLISGWLVGGSLLGKIGRPQALQAYAIDRLSRLWTVLVPTFLLMLLFGVLAGQLIPNTIDYSRSNSYSLLSFAGNLVGLQTVTLEPFGGNFPLWSLANETWYYLMFPLLLVLVTGSTPARRLLAMLTLVAIALALPYDMTLYFLVWLLGAIFSRVRVDCSNTVRWLMLAMFGVLAVYLRLTGYNDDMTAASFVQDLVYSLAFLLFLCSMHIKADPASRPIARLRSGATFFAEFSFTLYVFHIPLIRLMQHVGLNFGGTYRLSPANWIDYGIYFSLLGVVLVLSYGSYLLFESHTPKVRRWLKELLLSSPPVHAAAKR